MTKDCQHKKPSDPDTKWEDCTKKEAVIWKKKGHQIREKSEIKKRVNPQRL